MPNAEYKRPNDRLVTPAEVAKSVGPLVLLLLGRLPGRHETTNLQPSHYAQYQQEPDFPDRSLPCFNLIDCNNSTIPGRLRIISTVCQNH